MNFFSVSNWKTWLLLGIILILNVLGTVLSFAGLNGNYHAFLYIACVVLFSFAYYDLYTKQQP